MSKGKPISTYNKPEAYRKWFKEILEEYDYATEEIVGSIISIVRVRKYVKDERATDHLNYGKLVHDGKGFYLELTFKPGYSKEGDIIVSP